MPVSKDGCLDGTGHICSIKKEGWTVFKNIPVIKISIVPSSNILAELSISLGISLQNSRARKSLTAISSCLQKLSWL